MVDKKESNSILSILKPIQFVMVKLVAFSFVGLLEPLR